jgi:senataxin
MLLWLNQILFIALFNNFALLQVQLDSVVSKFQTLQHFFFVLCKLIKEGDLHKPDLPQNSSDDSKIRKYSSQGGFLTHPVFDSSSSNIDGHSLNVDLKLQENFRYLLSRIAWPSIRMFLVEGKAFIDYSLCQVLHSLTLMNVSI